MSRPLLHVKGLRKEFGARVILDIPELNLEAGKGYILTGDNGSGKTTLLRILAGLEPANIQKYYFDGRELSISELPVWLRHQIVYVHQHPYLFNTTVAHNIEYGLRARGLPRQVRATLVAEAIEWANVPNIASVSPARLSGGEKQRVALARAKVLNPKLILLDEPTANLDQVARTQTLALTERMRRDNNCVLIACHDYELIRLPHMHKLALVNGSIENGTVTTAKLAVV